jgi:hypothetical protein
MPEKTRRFRSLDPIFAPYPGVRIGLVYATHALGVIWGLTHAARRVSKPHARLVMTKGGLKDGACVEIDFGTLQPSGMNT